MAISPLSGIGAASIAGPNRSPSQQPQAAKPFKQALEAKPVAANVAPPSLQKTVSPTAAVAPGPTRAQSTQPRATAPVEASRPAAATQMLERMSAAQSRMDEVLKLAESGKSFTPAELLSLQAHVYQASQELDLAGKVVEKATSGIKQVLQTQV